MEFRLHKQLEMTNNVECAEPPISKNIRVIAEMEKEYLASRTGLERFGDMVAVEGGKSWFILLHAIWFSGWLAYNLAEPGFDPYPFPLLTLSVSLEAIFLSLFILMSQNRSNRQAERRAHFDLQINLLAEAEMTKMISMLQALCAAQNLPESRDPELAAMQKETNPSEVVRDLDEALSGS